MNDRFIYLNKLRVEVAKFYVTGVGAVFAAPTLISKLEFWIVLRLTGIPLLIVGVGIVIFDAKLRG